jgi:oxaloacetate decarboxylase alpha subunit
MITPFAQFVGTQAVLNVVHGERYRIVPNEVKKYVLGYYGKLLGPVDQNVFDRIVTNGSPDIPISPEPIEPMVDKLRAKYPRVTDEERLLRFMLPGKAIDEMIAAAEAGSEFSVASSIRPARVHLSRGDLTLKVSSR